MSEYTIREISKMFSMPSSTLRYYEDVGILTDIARNASGKRIYQEKHVNRLKIICCLKNAGMSIAQLQLFFRYEENDQEHMNDILNLLEEHKCMIEAKMKELKNDYAHLLRKIHYYQDMKESMETGKPRPLWKNYREKYFESNI